MFYRFFVRRGMILSPARGGCFEKGLHSRAGFAMMRERPFEGFQI